MKFWKVKSNLCADEGVLRCLASLNDRKWLKLLIRSINDPVYQGVELPKFPPDEVQRQFVGSAGEHALREAFEFYCVVKSCASRFGRPLTRDVRVLDFGCGWGRISRFFLKEILPDNLHGVDVDPSVIEICKKNFRYGTFGVVEPYPPTGFDSGSIDLIYAYSVFSHLAEAIHIKWVEEFSRILKPGGLVVVTTQGRSFIDFCRSLQGQKAYDHPWHEALARSFLDTDAALKDYDSGKFLYSPTGGGDFRPSDFYGEAVIPRAYVEREWTRFLAFRDFIDDRAFLPQALIVMQKPQ
jgi:SAM-dependent methyltransferase